MVQKGASEWSSSLRLEDTTEIGDERRKAAILSATVVEDQTLSNVIDIKRHCRLTKLLKVSAWVFRFIKNVKAKREGREIFLDRPRVDAIANAETRWVKDAQKRLQEEENLKKTKESLGIFEIDNVLVCKGRLGNAELQLEAKNPFFLPRENWFTQLLILESHKRVHHGGVRSTLTELGTKFWVLKGRQYVKKVLRSCLLCRKHEGKAFNPPPSAALPEFRVTQALPFSRLGVNLAGRFLLRIRMLRC